MARRRSSPKRFPIAEYAEGARNAYESSVTKPEFGEAIADLLGNALTLKPSRHIPRFTRRQIIQDEELSP